MVELVGYYDHSRLNNAPRGRILLPKIATGAHVNGRELIRQLRAGLEAKQVQGRHLRQRRLHAEPGAGRESSARPDRGHGHDLNALVGFCTANRER
jgi:hypothetical protein